MLRSDETSFSCEREVEPLPRLGRWREDLNRLPRAMRGRPHVYDARHYVPVLATKPGALRNGTPLKRDRQVVGILSAVLIDGLAPVEAACAEVRQHGVHSADVVLTSRPPMTVEWLPTCSQQNTS